MDLGIILRIGLSESLIKALFKSIILKAFSKNNLLNSSGLVLDFNRVVVVKGSEIMLVSTYNPVLTTYFFAFIGEKFPQKFALIPSKEERSCLNNSEFF